MSERLVDMFFSDQFIRDLGNAIKGVFPEFDLEKFRRLIYSEDWNSKELKAKMHHTSDCMAATLPQDYAQAHYPRLKNDCSCHWYPFKTTGVSQVCIVTRRGPPSRLVLQSRSGTISSSLSNCPRAARRS